MRKLLVIVSILSVSAFAAGCKKGGTCEAAIDNAIEVSLKEAPADQKEATKGIIEGLKPELIKKCNEQKPSAEALTCASNAKTTADLKACKGFDMK